MRYTWSRGLAVVAGGILLSSQAHAQTLATGETFHPPLLRLVLGLLLCIVIAYLFALVLKNMQKGRGQYKGFSFLLSQGGKTYNRINVIETRRINAHADVCLLSLDDRESLVIISQNQIIVLHENELASTDESDS